MCKHLQLGLTRPRRQLSLESFMLPSSGRVSPNSTMLYHSGPSAGPSPGVSDVLRHRRCSCPRPDPVLAASLAVGLSGAEETVCKRNVSRLLSAGHRGGKALRAQRSPGNAQRGNLTLNRWQLLPGDGKETEDIPRQHFGLIMQIERARRGKLPFERIRGFSFTRVKAGLPNSVAERLQDFRKVTA